jgi:hypothetical protein
MENGTSAIYRIVVGMMQTNMCEQENAMAMLAQAIRMTTHVVIKQLIVFGMMYAIITVLHTQRNKAQPV